jgi:ABC-type nickel/cobalt efflux system permease component RcnA
MRDVYVLTHVYLWMTLTLGFSCCLIFLRGVALFEASVAFLPSLAKDVVPHLVSWDDGALLTKRASKIDAAEFGAH